MTISAPKYAFFSWSEGHLAWDVLSTQTIFALFWYLVPSLWGPLQGVDFFRYQKLPFNNFPCFLSDKGGVSLALFSAKSPFLCFHEVSGAPWSPQREGLRPKTEIPRGVFRLEGQLPDFLGLEPPKRNAKIIAKTTMLHDRWKKMGYFPPIRH